MGNSRNYSKGCKTCIQRKVKCDGEHPTCRRCKKSGFSCEGFSETLFVDAREQVMKRFVGGSKKDLHKGTSTASTRTRSSRQIDSTMHDDATAVISDCSQDALRAQHSLPAQISMCPLPSRDELYVSFIVGNLFKGPSASLYRDVLPYNNSNRRPHQSVMSQCLLTLATVFFGIQNRDSRTFRDGICLYSRALSMLNDILGTENTSVTTEIIVSVLSIMPNSNFSWMIHILGLERLFALRGPVTAEDNDGLDGTLLEICRPVMILAAFFTQRPSLMSHREWKVTQQPDHPEETPMLYQNSGAASDMSFLMRILADLPSIYIECDKYVQLASKRSFPQPTNPLAVLWTRIGQLHQELQVWKQQWNKANRKKLDETLPLTKFDPPEPTTDWQNVFAFETVETAITFAMYHSVSILLLSIPKSLYRAGLDSSLLQPPMTRSSSSNLTSDLSHTDQSLHLPSDIKNSIHNICHSTEYHLHFHALSPPAQAPADYYLFFPVHVARRASRQLGYEAELAWLSVAHERLRERYSMGVWARMDFGSRFSGLEEGLFG